MNEYIDTAFAKILESRGKFAIGNDSEIQFQIFEEPADNEGRKTG